MNVWLQLAKMRAGQAVAQAGADLVEDAKKDPEWLELGKSLVGIALFKAGLDIIGIGDDNK